MEERGEGRRRLLLPFFALSPWFVAMCERERPLAEGGRWGGGANSIELLLIP